MKQVTENSECLSDEQLEQILASETKVSFESETHLQICVDCRRRLDSLGESDYLKSWSSIAGSSQFQTAYFGHETSEKIPITGYGRFTLESRIGSGGMGTVYRAIDQPLGRTVAVKVLNRFDDPTAQRRFEREAKALSRLDHPHIVPVFTFDQSTDGKPFLVMPYIDGETLRSVLQVETLEPSRAAEIIRQIALGLHAAHTIGLIHRDVKSANIIIEKHSNAAKLVDFGLARLSDAQSLTKNDVICGTPEYMSPEQADDSVLTDPRSDLYGLGITLYECLAGTTPFHGRPLDILTQHREIEPVPPSRINQAVPRDLETICLKALRKEPANRYANLEQFADDLKNFIDGRPIFARPVGVLGKLKRWANRNRPLAAAISLLFLSLLVGTFVSTTFWLKSERNATLANNRNSQLVTSQQILQDNHDVLRRSLQNSFRDTMRNENAFVQLPTSVRNTSLIAFLQTSQLLVDASQHDANALREISQELTDAADFALNYQMEMRAVEISHLGRDVIERLFELEHKPSTDDFLISAKALNRFARAQLMLIELGASDPALLTTSTEASIQALARSLRAIEQFEADSRAQLVEHATLEMFNARYNLVLAGDNGNTGQKISRFALLDQLADDIKVEPKSDDLAIAWARLQADLLYDLAREVSPTQAIGYLKLRGELFEQMQQLQHQSDGKVDSWTIRSIAKNETMMGLQHALQGNTAEARNSYVSASQKFQGLCELYALSGYYRISWFESLSLLASLDWENNQRESALNTYAQALNQIKLLSQMNPQDENVAKRAAELHREIGQRYVENKQPDLAARMFRDGAGFAERAASNPFRMDRDPTFYNELASDLHARADELQPN